MRFYRLSSILFVIVILLSACGQASTLARVTPPAKPQSEKTTVIGRALDKKTGEPLANRVLRLGEILRREGAAEDDGLYVMDASTSPGARTDANGYFIFQNIDAKEYVLLLQVIADNTYSVAKEDNGKPRRWKTEVGNVIDFGSVYFGQDMPQE